MEKQFRQKPVDSSGGQGRLARLILWITLLEKSTSIAFTATLKRMTDFAIFSWSDTKKIIKKLSLYKRKEIFQGNTLIIFDEIQACPEAITSLKYFNEEANGYHIIALGFEEYLMARWEDGLIELIRECYENDTPLDSAFHERALDYYKEYLFVGGMPEAVEEYGKNHNPELVRIIQQTILESYQNDMGKYNRQSEIPKTRIVYKNISTQLAKENRKFQYII